MITIILILIVGILLVNMYFFKAVCKSNDTISKSIDVINKQIEYIDSNVKTLANIQRNIEHNTNSISKSIMDIINNINFSKIEILDVINKNIDTSVQVLTNNQENMDKALVATYSDVQNSIRIINESKIEILDTIVNNITVKPDNIYKPTKPTKTVNAESNPNVIFNVIKRNYESIDSRIDLISAKLSKLMDIENKDIYSNNEWKVELNNTLNKIYSEAVEARNAVISLKLKPVSKPKNPSSKDSKTAK